MAQLEFEYSQSIIIIQVNLTDLFSKACNKYYQKSDIKPNSVFFMKKTMVIPGNKKIIDLMDETEKESKKMHISVFPLYIDENDKVIIESKEVICPKCFEPCRIKILDYIVYLFDCKNNHSIAISLDKFKETQKINLTKIICNICKVKNMGNMYDNTFFSCLSCKKNMCVLCKSIHNNNHAIINYEKKNYICPLHNDSFFKFCHNCKINICMLCNNGHINHILEPFENIISNADNKRIELDKLQKEIIIFNTNVKKIITGLNQLIENMETYYNIFNNIFNNYNVHNKNYQVLKNISQINIENNIYKEIFEINKNENYLSKINNIFNIFYKMKGKNNKDPFNFFKSNSIEKDYKTENHALFLFKDIPSYIKKETNISKDSIYRCNYCPYIPLMKIMYKGYKIYMEYRCQNRHYSYEKLYDFYQRNKMNSINSVICSVGFEINDGKQNFYYCNDCKTYFCEKDKMAHEKIDKKCHNLINLKNIDNICSEHLNTISDYCQDCHKNICNRCITHANHKKISLSKLIIKDNKIIEYRNKLNKLKKDYNNFYDECDKTIREVLDYIEIFNENLKKFKIVNDYSFNICEDLLNSYQYLKNKNSLNYEIIENINSILNFNDIKFNMDKNFNCLARLIYINSIIKLEYNTLFKLNNNFINFDLQITEEEEKLIKRKNMNNNVEYKRIIDKNFECIYYGYFTYNHGNERTFEINGFGIKIDKNQKYIGEFQNGKIHGYGIYYFDSGAYKFVRTNFDTTEVYKLYTIKGEIVFCLYNKIIKDYQKYGVYYIEKPNGTKKINIIKNNNFDDYGLMYNINGEFYEGYYLSNYRHGYGILKSEAEDRIKKGLFYKNELKFGSQISKDWIIEGEFNMGLKDGYVIEYDRLKRISYEGQYKDGKKEGFGISYYDNGNIRYKGYYRNNLEDIFGFVYNASGKLFYSGHIDKGQKKGFGIYYAYDQNGKKLYQYSGYWINDAKCDGYLLKKFSNGDYFFGYTKIFVYQTFMKYKQGNTIYIGDTKVSSLKREGYGETIYSNGSIEKGIYINDKLVLNKSY